MFDTGEKWSDNYLYSLSRQSGKQEIGAIENKREKNNRMKMGTTIDKYTIYIDNEINQYKIICIREWLEGQFGGNA